MNFIILFVILNSFPLWARPHLDLEMTSQEYRSLLKRLPQNKLRSTNDDPAITYSIELGTRLSQWISAVNAARTPERAIRLTSPQTRRGIPIESPNIYSPSIIQKDLQKLLKDMPSEMKNVILAESELPATLHVDDQTFIKHARLLDKNYQQAARYKSIDQWRNEYIAAAAYDVRGYYYLNKNKISKEELKDITLISTEKLEEIKDALLKLCLNTGFESRTDCQRNLDRSLAQNSLDDFYGSYYPYGEMNWNSFFEIPSFAIREDVAWTASTMTVPFNTPSITKFIPYLQENVEDEFQFGDWKLLLNFGTFTNGPLLVFKPGVVPHVNALGGNQIVMDSNQPIEEYESQWTIRHEFGHVIGLPDCYHEFYDTNLNAYVNYQLDVSDLMCSRAGDMKERIYLELQKAYAP